MVRLMSMLYVMIATVLMGMGVVAVLASGMGTTKPIMIAAAAGLALAVPVSWRVTRAILKGQEIG